MSNRGTFEVASAMTLAAALREQLPNVSWRRVRALCASGKVAVEGSLVIEPATRLAGGERVVWDLGRPDPRRRAILLGFRIVFEDGHLLIIEKPEGISTAPFEPRETGTALDLVREAWRRQGKRATCTPLYVVHRIDKSTSGLVCFAKTKLAERGLHHIFQNHLAERAYIAVAHGQVPRGRIESHLVRDRGDGLRGSSRKAGVGQYAMTMVETVTPLVAATLCRLRLRTGRTHQIRIHLAEQGHPLVGDLVYLRDFIRRGGKPIASPRLLLHAATLGFEHPVTQQRLLFTVDPPPDFDAVVATLRS